MQQVNGKGAEPSMDDILASIRKIISEDPPGAKSSVQRPVAVAPPAPSLPLAPAVPAAAAKPAVPTRLSDIMRELAPSAVPVSAPSPAYHDDIADMVEGGVNGAEPSRLPAMGERLHAGAEPKTLSPPSSLVSPPVPTLFATPEPPIPATARMEALRTGDLGAFVPKTADMARNLTPRLPPLPAAAEVRAPELAPSFTPMRHELAPEPEMPEHAAVEQDEPMSSMAAPEPMALDGADTDRAAQSALGALAVGLAAPANIAVSPASDPMAMATDGALRRPLDDAILDMLRPMVRDWLDAHLPAMVDKALKEQLAATARREP